MNRWNHTELILRILLVVLHQTRICRLICYFVRITPFQWRLSISRRYWNLMVPLTISAIDFWRDCRLNFLIGISLDCFTSMVMLGIILSRKDLIFILLFLPKICESRWIFSWLSLLVSFDICRLNFSVQLSKLAFGLFRLYWMILWSTAFLRGVPGILYLSISVLDEPFPTLDYIWVLIGFLWEVFCLMFSTSLRSVIFAMFCLPINLSFVALKPSWWGLVLAWLNQRSFRSLREIRLSLIRLLLKLPIWIDLIFRLWMVWTQIRRYISSIVDLRWSCFHCGFTDRTLLDDLFLAPLASIASLFCLINHRLAQIFWMRWILWSSLIILVRRSRCLLISYSTHGFLIEILS